MYHFAAVDADRINGHAQASTSLNIINFGQ